MDALGFRTRESACGPECGLRYIQQYDSGSGLPSCRSHSFGAGLCHAALVRSVGAAEAQERLVLRSF